MNHIEELRKLARTNEDALRRVQHAQSVLAEAIKPGTALETKRGYLMSQSSPSGGKTLVFVPKRFHKCPQFNYKPIIPLRNV